MDNCRICLAKNPKKYIDDLVIPNENLKKSSVILFCLGIKIKEDDEHSTKLCSKCFKKLVEFSNFKTLALQNNTLFLSNANVKIEKIDFDNVGNDLKVKNEDGGNFNNNDFDEDQLNDIQGTDFSVKSEDEDNNNEFDDDLFLSVVKDMKNENMHEEITEIISTNIEKVSKVKIKYKKKKYPVKKQVCNKCGKLVGNLTEHLRTHQLPENRVRKVIPCKVCGKEFHSYSSRRRHTRVKHDGLKEHCDKCGKDYVCLWSHFRQVHSPQNKPFGCERCGQRFLCRATLAEHLLRHDKPKPYECTKCDAKLSSKLTLNTHMRQVHDQEKSHQCEFCSKTFFKRDALLVHIRRHTKEKPYHCKECDKGFPSSTALKVHTTVHTGDRRFQCPHCDMTFARNGNLWKHIICHTKEKKYPCKYCGVAFYRSDHRKRHEFTAHEKIHGLVIAKPQL